MATRLQELYKSTVRANMQEQFEYKNVMEIPKVTKIVIIKKLKTEKKNNSEKTKNQN